MRREERPWIDGAYVPLPAVWVVREPGRRAVFVTNEPRWARLVADARAHGRPDPYLDEEDGT